MSQNIYVAPSKMYLTNVYTYMILHFEWKGWQIGMVVSPYNLGHGFGGLGFRDQVQIF
jgi:hypothetical protein